MILVSVGINLAPQSGGTFRTVGDFLEAFRLKNHAATVLNFSKYSPNASPAGALTLATTRIPVVRSYQWSRHVYGRTVHSAIRAADLVFIHGVFVHPLLEASKIATRYGVPYVLVPHGSLDPYSLVVHGKRKKLWLSVHSKTLFERSAAVLYGTECEMDRSWAHGLETRPVCIPWPTGGDHSTDREGARERIRRKHDIAPGARLALFCARMARVKRPLETIQAFLAAAPPDWVLLCVGPPTPEVPFSKIEAMCAASGRRCICVGPIFGSALPDYFSAADLFLLLSHSENYGHSAAEALFQGVPVVISPDVGLGPYIKRYGGGFVSGGASFNDMCEALRSAMQLSPESLAEIGRTGKGWVERELSPVHFADRLNALCLSSGKRTQNRPGRSAIEAVCR